MFALELPLRSLDPIEWDVAADSLYDVARDADCTFARDVARMLRTVGITPQLLLWRDIRAPADAWIVADPQMLRAGKLPTGQGEWVSCKHYLRVERDRTNRHTFGMPDILKVLHPSDIPPGVRWDALARLYFENLFRADRCTHRRPFQTEAASYRFAPINGQRRAICNLCGESAE